MGTGQERCHTGGGKAEETEVELWKDRNKWRLVRQPTNPHYPHNKIHQFFKCINAKT
jgi:hypothetical protein